MPSSRALQALKWLTRNANGSFLKPDIARCFSTSTTQYMAVEAQESSYQPISSASDAVVSELAAGSSQTGWRPPPPVLATLYSFPSMEPLRFAEYPPEHLQMPLRKDLLHRAVVYEGDKTRHGTASSKWRDDVHGSGRKLRAQKGSGMARVGDKKSPTRRGGGVAFGPHPRDFATGLPRKVYDKAWRIALSYRFNRGQLMIVDNQMSMPQDATPWFFQEFFKVNRWGRGNGRSTLITDVVDEDLFAAIGELDRDAKILDREDVDVKDLLETGRLIIERKALDKILREHSKDLRTEPARAKYD